MYAQPNNNERPHRLRIQRKHCKTQMRLKHSQWLHSCSVQDSRRSENGGTQVLLILSLFILSTTFTIQPNYCNERLSLPSAAFRTSRALLTGVVLPPPPQNIHAFTFIAQWVQRSRCSICVEPHEFGMTPNATEKDAISPFPLTVVSPATAVFSFASYALHVRSRSQIHAPFAKSVPFAEYFIKWPLVRNASICTKNRCFFPERG